MRTGEDDAKPSRARIFLIAAGAVDTIKYSYTMVRSRQDGPRVVTMARRRLGGETSSLTFDLKALEVYLTVCESGTMTAAAHRLGMTQPAVSLVIRSLEDALGVTLLDRKLKPLGLTPAGGMLRQRAHRLLDEARQLAPAVRQSSRTKLSLVRIGIVDSFATLFGPLLAHAMRELAAQTTIWNGLSPEHGEALLKRALDLAITTDDLEDVDGLDRYPLLQEPFMLCLPATRTGRPGRGLAELTASMPLIRYSARSTIGISIDRHLRRVGLDVPRHQEFDTSDVVLALVAAGLGWAITTPLCVIDARPPADRVVLAPLPGPGFSRRLSLVARTGELGEAPAVIADLARGILRERFMTEACRLMPWVRDSLRIG